MYPGINPMSYLLAWATTVWWEWTGPDQEQLLRLIQAQQWPSTHLQLTGPRIKSHPSLHPAHPEKPGQRQSGGVSWTSLVKFFPIQDKPVSFYSLKFPLCFTPRGPLWKDPSNVVCYQILFPLQASDVERLRLLPFVDFFYEAGPVHLHQIKTECMWTCRGRTQKVVTKLSVKQFPQGDYHFLRSHSSFRPGLCDPYLEGLTQLF